MPALVCFFFGEVREGSDSIDISISMLVFTPSDVPLAKSQQNHQQQSIKLLADGLWLCCVYILSFCCCLLRGFEGIV